MKIEVLGMSCKKCADLHQRVEQAMEQAGVEAELVKLEGLDAMMARGCTVPPGLAIDGELICAGKLPKVAKIAEWIKAKSSA